MKELNPGIYGIGIDNIPQKQKAISEIEVKIPRRKRYEMLAAALEDMAKRAVALKANYEEIYKRYPEFTFDPVFVGGTITVAELRIHVLRLRQKAKRMLAELEDDSIESAEVNQSIEPTRTEGEPADQVIGVDGIVEKEEVLV